MLRKGNWTRTGRLNTRYHENILQTAVQAALALLALYMASQLPCARAALIEEKTLPQHTDPSKVSSYMKNDVLAFESFPRSVSMSMTSETVNMSMLGELESTLLDA